MSEATVRTMTSSPSCSCFSNICKIFFLRPKAKFHLAILLTAGLVLGTLLTMNVKLRHSIENWTGQLATGLDWENWALLSQIRPSPLPSMQFYIDALNAKSPRRNDSFDPQINETELTSMLNLMWTFLDLCEQNNIQVMLYGGSLLGSYRHHGVMPWDDDIDLMMNVSDQGKLEKLLHSKDKRHQDLVLKKAGRWKVWNSSACLWKKYSWCWPYIDLSFYRLSEGKVFDTVTAYGYNYSYPAIFTFPLHKRPFMGRWVLSPRDSLRFLGFDKDATDKCISLYYSHKFEGSPVKPVMKQRCSSLTVTYPFVVRIPNNVGTGVLEVLRFDGGRPVYSVSVDEPPNALNVEYSIVPFE